MVILVDPPNSAGHDRLWSHVASDESFAELHAFARSVGIPERGFDGDHYDVPAEWYDRMVAAGAQPVSSRHLVERLTSAGLRRAKAHTLGPRRPGRRLVRPARLRPGDVVAVVAPAGPVDPARLAAGIAVLERWGLRVRRGLTDRGPETPPWLAAADEDRAAHLTDAMTDPEVTAVWALRGGYGTQRLLDRLDWDRLAAASPRLLVGFSDITALHQAVAARLGLASLHAPGVAGLADSDPAAVEATRRLVMEGREVPLRGVPDPAGGEASGVLVGGNLTMLASSAGTSLVRTATGGIALLEDVGERPYRLDRALTQLVRTGWFEGVRGVALGAFTDCGDDDQVRDLLRRQLDPLGVPVIHDLPFGHQPHNLPVPLGVTARLEAGAGTLTASPLVR